VKSLLSQNVWALNWHWRIYPTHQRGSGKNVQQIEEVLGVIDPKGDMCITFDVCHALETKQLDNLLKHFGPRVCKRAYGKQVT